MVDVAAGTVDGPLVVAAVHSSMVAGVTSSAALRASALVIALATRWIEVPAAGDHVTIQFGLAVPAPAGEEAFSIHRCLPPLETLSAFGAADAPAGESSIPVATVTSRLAGP